jgi:hypothetical protein
VWRIVSTELAHEYWVPTVVHCRPWNTFPYFLRNYSAYGPMSHRLVSSCDYGYIVEAIESTIYPSSSPTGNHLYRKFSEDGSLLILNDSCNFGWRTETY